jgi:cell division protein FtsB
MGRKYFRDSKSGALILHDSFGDVARVLRENEQQSEMSSLKNEINTLHTQIDNLKTVLQSMGITLNAQEKA